MKRIAFTLIALLFSHAVFSNSEFEQTLQRAKAGDLEAQVDAGMSYESGNGVVQDYQQARFWYEAAAAKGNADAQMNLAYLYLNGYGVKQDFTRALYWFENSAKQGHDGSQYLLGTMYENGMGVPEDYQEAEKWYRLAANQGLEDAQKALNSLVQKKSETSNSKKPLAGTEPIVTTPSATSEKFQEASADEVIMGIYPVGSLVSVTSKLSCYGGNFSLSGKTGSLLLVPIQNGEFSISQKKKFISQCDEVITVRGMAAKTMLNVVE